MKNTGISTITGAYSDINDDQNSNQNSGLVKV